jgi:hypothetical protein
MDATLAVAEELLAEEANYDFVMMLLEDVQNLVSHRLEIFLSPAEVAALGPRYRVCWRTLKDFWAAVAAWCAEALPPLQSSEQILSVQNSSRLLWTGNRTQLDGTKVGLAEAVRYEQAVGVSIPGFSHVVAALKAAGQY